ncbi:MAG: Fic family protein [Bacteroidia bacterium]
MREKFNLLSGEYFAEYSKQLNKVVSPKPAKGISSAKEFERSLAASAVFSLKIDGSKVGLNAFLNSRKEKTGDKKKSLMIVNGLFKAYKFASKNKMSSRNFMRAHSLFSKEMVWKASERGKYRKTPIGIFDNVTGKPVYFAVEAEHISSTIEKLFEDIKTLSKRKLDGKEAMYYASMIHIWVMLIYPFSEGNGIIARLLEKWFLASHLGKDAWAINSEKYYFDNRVDYLKNISLGHNYYALNWEKSMPFLLMLPNAV